jgi:AGZA family xanthine/uracil permease-like MFS transporter
VLAGLDAVFSSSEYSGIILVTAIPFGIYDLVEAMRQAVKSAEAAAIDVIHHPRPSADGIVSLIGCDGQPFINAVYIGHPGWKAMGGRIATRRPDGDHP